MTVHRQRQAPSFSSLPRAQQLAIAKALRPHIAAFGGGSYDAVQGDTARQHAPAIVELNGEDDILTAPNRNKLTNLMRQEMRNAPLTRTIDQQRRVNVVGLIGGKLTLTTSDTDFNDRVQAWFNEDWAPSAEFTDSLHFNENLKLTISSLDNGGDIVKVFDNALFDDSGKIRAFESDEIANMQQAEFDRRYQAKGWKQSQGRIADRYGRTIGAVVSTSQRGRSEFDADKCFVLVRDVRTDPRDAHFIFAKATWRFNQGRGVSPRSSAINTLMSIYSLLGSETEAAKLNAKLFGQLVDQSQTAPEDSIPNEYRPTADDPNGETPPTDGLETQSELADAAPIPVTFDGLKEIGAVYDVMPPQMKWELIETARPNEKVIDFVNFQAGMATGVHGLGRIYATLNPEASYTAFRGAQCLSWPSIEESQKELERKECDWAARNAIRWALDRRIIPGLRTVPDRWETRLSWKWPEMREVNEVDAETARTKKLANMVTTFRDIHGPNWEKILEQAEKEIKWCQDRGIVHPALQTVSGGTVAAPANNNQKDKAS